MKRGRKRIPAAIGETFGDLVVVGSYFRGGRTMAKCQCKCGKTVSVVASQLKRLVNDGRTPHCGCSDRRGGSKRKPWSIERTKEIIDLRRNGISSGEIGRIYNISRERVCQILRPLGLASKPKLDIGEVASLISGGINQREIAEQLGRGEMAIHLFIARNQELAKLYKEYEAVRAKRYAEIRHQKFNDRYKNQSWNGVSFVRRLHGNQCVFTCSCGQEFISDIRNVIMGGTKSCGCRMERYVRAKMLGFDYDKETGKVVGQYNGVPNERQTSTKVG
jgi:DNA-binding CsgD family transcriptional regulator